MEPIKEIALRQNSLQNLSPISTEQTHEISIYNGSLSVKSLIKNVAVIKKAFPSLPIEFFDILTDRVKANGFSDDRLTDAVNYVVDNCIYPFPTIAQFISFDRKFKFYTYDEMLKKWGEGTPPDLYKPVKLPDREKDVFVHVDDIKQFKL